MRSRLFIILKNKTVVAFEDLIVNGVVVRRHEDIDDIAQTNWIPKIRTTMESDFGLKDALADYEQKLIDTVPYWNLVPGKTYTLKGTLMDMSTGKASIIDDKKIEGTDVPKAENTKNTG